MIDIPEQINVTGDGSFLAVCNRICTSLKPSGNREQDEELLFEMLCRHFAESGRTNVSFTPRSDSSKIDNLKEYLFLLIDNQDESDYVVEQVYEFLDNVYPQEGFWRLKM